MRKLIIGTTFLSTVWLIGCLNGNSTGNESLTPELIEGKALYLTYCAGCHGKSGDLGLNGALPLSASKIADAEAQELILKGRNVMVGFEGVISTGDIELIIEYIKTFRK